MSVGVNSYFKAVGQHRKCAAHRRRLSSGAWRTCRHLRFFSSMVAHALRIRQRPTGAQAHCAAVIAVEFIDRNRQQSPRVFCAGLVRIGYRPRRQACRQIIRYYTAYLLSERRGPSIRARDMHAVDSDASDDFGPIELRRDGYGLDAHWDLIRRRSRRRRRRWRNLIQDIKPRRRAGTAGERCAADKQDYRSQPLAGHLSSPLRPRSRASGCSSR